MKSVKRGIQMVDGKVAVLFICKGSGDPVFLDMGYFFQKPSPKHRASGLEYETKTPSSIDRNGRASVVVFF